MTRPASGPEITSTAKRGAPLASGSSSASRRPWSDTSPTVGIASVGVSR